MLDVGKPLKEGSQPVNVAAFDPDAILLSHTHQDHYGLIEGLDRTIPVYLSKLEKNLIDAACMFSKQELLGNQFRFFEPWRSFEIGPFRITPYLVDHSAPDAFGFLVEAGGGRLFYTGDFRAHGRKRKLYERLIREPFADLDVLVMEGTMLKRSDGGFPNELSVEEEIVRVIRDARNASFLVCSSQNVDRLVSAFNACRRTEKKLVIDIYTAWVLQQMELVSDSVPNMFWDEVKVIATDKQELVVDENPDFFGAFGDDVGKPEHGITHEVLDSSPADYLQAIRLPGARLVDWYLSKEPVNVIFSQWLGDLEDNSERIGARDMRRLRDDSRVNFVYAHTSGHAFLPDLKKLAASLKPKVLIPVHTDFPHEFETHFDNVRVLEDEQKLEIQ